ncbi:MAG: GNAT family N-acetyltransferase [Flavobacteriaceae bacterium]|nr:GNAT family N-acetyltransferase [Flavobacteriaceae bacterium]
MENDKFTFKIVEGVPSKELLESILIVYKSIFDDYKLDFFMNRIHEKEDLLIVLCYDQNQLVGYKIGYRYSDTTFYSWIGGVLPEQRNHGIAKQLAQLQEKRVREKGYVKIRTKSMNRFKPMMILNLKSGFDIKSIYTNSIGQTKIVFEKNL